MFKLVWVTETAPETDENGKEKPGSSCYVEMPLPPGLAEKQSRNRDAIRRAVFSAVYEEGLEAYGNKVLKIIIDGDEFSIPFERETITRLTPPAMESPKKSK